MILQGLLPIGSVLMLQEGDHRVMITGYAHHLPDNDKVYDYSGCMWPEGVFNAEQNLLFNHEDIATVYFIGTQTDEQMAFVAQVEKALEDYRKSHT